MNNPLRRSLGLLGRIVAILLLTVAIEFGVSTLLYERASRLLIQEDEARRLAEHLVIARKLVVERPRYERPELADELTTDRYDVHWTPTKPPPAPLTPQLDEMRRQIVAWEPSLTQANLRLRLDSPGRRSAVTGYLRLPDGSWLQFGTREIVHGGWDLALNRILLALVPALGLLIIGALMIRQTLSPLRRLAQATERIGFGEEVHIPEAGTFEVRRLIRAFNVMQERIHKLIDDRTQALAAVGHDLRTPLARLQLRLDGVDDREAREALGEDVAEMEAMVASLLAYLGGEGEPEKPVKIDLAVLVQTMVDNATDRDLDAAYDGPEHLDAVVRKLSLRRALGNLIANAIHYGGSAHVTLFRRDDTIVICVEDKGPGIPEDQLEAVLQPFIRLDAARGRYTGGLGLGLAIVVKAVEGEGGTLHLANRAEGGLRAEIRLPA